MNIDFMRDFHDYYTLKEIVERRGYEWFTGDMNMNFIGVRTDETLTNKFADFYIWAHDIGEHKRVLIYPGTTDPSPDTLHNPGNPLGLARVEPGQHRKAFKLGDHRGKPALRNDRAHPLAYRRYDPVKGIINDTIHHDYIGAHHHSSGNGRDADKDIGPWSLGCQVATYHEDIITARNKVIFQGYRGHGNNVTYTLLELKDLRP